MTDKILENQRKLAEKIRHLLVSHDMPGIIHLASPGHTSVVMFLSPESGCLEQRGEKLSLADELEKLKTSKNPEEFNLPAMTLSVLDDSWKI